VSRGLEREVDAERFIRLDRMLIAERQRHGGVAGLRPDRGMRGTLRQYRALLIQRARRLERMRLATELEAGRRTVSNQAEPVLREIIKAMHRALERGRPGRGARPRALRPALR
jgi:hypothetical protein